MISQEQYLITRIKREIPTPILIKTYTPTTSDMFNMIPLNLDYILSTRVINNWVLNDCNIVSGKEMVIDVSNSRFRQLDMTGLICDIDPRLTDGKEILTVLSASFIRNVDFIMSPTIASSFSGPDTLIEPRAYPVGPFTIFINTLAFSPTILRVMVALAKNFSDINVRALELLGRMVVLACKADIYNELKIKIANSVVLNGEDLPTIGGIVDSYADCAEMYNKLLTEEWIKTSIMADRNQWNRMLRVGVPY